MTGKEEKQQAEMKRDGIKRREMDEYVQHCMNYPARERLGLQDDIHLHFLLFFFRIDVN